MPFLGFITAGVGAVLLIIGVLALFSARIRTFLRGIPVANKIFSPMTWAVVFIVVGFLAGGVGVVSNYVGVGDISLTSEEAQTTSIGGLDLKVHDGLANTTATEDYYNDDETELTFYSADANIADGEEYKWNITAERKEASEAGVILVSCNIPDKEISGITANNLAEKTGGQVDLDINDGGKHSDDNTVYRRFALSEGTISQEIEVAFDQEETYHDGMTDLDDYVDITCTVSEEGTSISSSVRTRVYTDG